MSLRNIKLTAELTNEDGTVAARMTTEYFNLSPDNVLFVEKHLIIDPLTAINEAAAADRDFDRER